MSDRVIVVSSGKIAGILERDDFSQEKIMHLATGGA
jgi:ABC-type sugar transport system ATPase subunit